MKESYSHYLTNQFLIAMPQLEGSEFARSLIYLVSHNELPEINITSSQDILFSIAENKGPQQSLIVLGYAGWGAGQLEKELLDNSWLTCPFRSDIVFDIPAEQRLDVALGQLGIHFSSLSLQVGHA